jgi:hypothetical protein
MSIVKLLVGAAIAAAPLGVASAQSSTTPDSSNNSRAWLAGTGAAAGAGLFLALTHSGNHASANSFSFHAPQTPPPGQPTPTGGTTPPSHTDSASVPTDTGTVAPPDTGEKSPVVNDDSPPTNYGPLMTTEDAPTTDEQTFTPAASTVPEPGSAALLVTGIIGLAPLLRKRRK